MHATTRPLEQTIDTPRRRIPARRVLRRAGWLALDLAATAAFALYALHALS